MSKLQTRLNLETFKTGLAIIVSANPGLSFKDNSTQTWFDMVNYLEPSLFKAAVVRVRQSAIPWPGNIGLLIKNVAADIAKETAHDDTTVYEKPPVKEIIRGKAFLTYFHRCVAKGIRMDDQLVEDVKSDKKDISELEKVFQNKTKRIENEK